jgi:hypothetical protein
MWSGLIEILKVKLCMEFCLEIGATSIGTVYIVQT